MTHYQLLDSMRKIVLWKSLALVILLGACNNDGNKQNDQQSSETLTTSDSVQITEKSPDSLSEEHKTVSAESNTLTTTGSNLSADQSNLNVDVQLAADQLFDFNKSTLKPEAEQVLSKLAANLQAMGGEPVKITGHTDSKGDDSYNKKLSLERANSVKDWLLKHGLDNKFITEGKGEDEPIAENTTADGKDSEEGRAKNRRVEVKYLGTQSISK